MAVKTICLCARVCVCVQSSPYLEIRQPPDDETVHSGNGRYEGYCVELSDQLFGVKLGMNYELRLVADKKYGGRLDNGTWDGMVGELTNHVC